MHILFTGTFHFFSVAMTILIAFLFVQYRIQVSFLNQEGLFEPRAMLDPNRYVHELILLSPSNFITTTCGSSTCLPVGGIPGSIILISLSCVKLRISSSTT